MEEIIDQYKELDVEAFIEIVEMTKRIYEIVLGESAYYIDLDYMLTAIEGKVNENA